jgi:tetratricopeptide (TPR) repeat protein
MEQTFTPQAARPVDTLSTFFSRANRFLILSLLAIMPLVFIPGMIGPFKTFFAIFVVLVSVVVGGLGILRQGTIPRFIPVILLAWFGVIGTAFVSALLSADVVYSLRGDMLETQTVAFLLLLGVIMMLMMPFGQDKKAAVWMIILPIITAVILALHQLFRFFFTGTFLDFGVLSNPSDTLIGGFNDLGIFLTATILIMLVAVIQLALPRKVLFGVLVIISLNLLILMVINISYLWIVLGLTSLLLLMFLLTRDRFLTSPSNTPVPIVNIVIMSLVFLVSAVFFVGGSNLGATVSSWAGVNYIEVRPSITATLDIMRHTMADNAFTGIGPNRFADAWHLYKDPSINQTMFWNTGFGTGSSYVLTWFATTGIIGILAWVIFFVLFLYRGVRTLFMADDRDPLWYFIGTVSFVLALFLWGTLWLYVAGPFILVLAAMMTGLYLASERSLRMVDEPFIPKLFISTRAGFVLIGVVMLTIVTTVAVGYTTARQFVSLTTFIHAADGVEGDDAVAQVSARLARAYSYYPSDIYLRDIVAYQLVQLNTLLALPEPDANQRQEFNSIIETIVSVADESVRLRPFRARNWATLGDVFAILAQLEIEGADIRANENYQKAITLDPINPYYQLQMGLLSIRSGDREAGRAKITQSLQLKQNYVEALSVLAQLDIDDGNLEQAINTTEAMVILEPNNPGRLYQLGLIYGAAGNREAALTVINRAIEINPQFANARYLRSLHLYAAGQVDDAVRELETVLGLDANNTVVNDIITQMRAGTFVPDFTLTSQSVNEPRTVSIQEDVVTASGAPDSDLISPVNTPARSDNTATQANQDGEVATETGQ